MNEGDMLIDNNEQSDLVLEETQDFEEEAYITYDITTYPSDYTLSVIAEMWKNGDMVIPEFQRQFIWSIQQSSLLIESFLMGLPVPQVFVYVDEVNKNLVIDGQQRIRSIIYYLEGYFGAENLRGKRQVFRLKGLSDKSPYHEKRFVDLKESDQRKLKNAVLRFINVRQLDPKGQTSVFHIFERLNTGGTALNPQEIRNCVFHGAIVDILRELNMQPEWRDILGKKEPDKHQKDIELILRILSLYESWGNYEKPMKEYLNVKMDNYKNAKHERVIRFQNLFPDICKKVINDLGAKPFHVRGPLNSSVLDSVMCTLLESRNHPNNLSQRFNQLKLNPDYEKTTYYGTSDEKVLKQRFKLAKEYLSI